MNVWEVLYESFLFYNNDACNNGSGLRLYIAIIILPLFKILTNFKLIDNDSLYIMRQLQLCIS
jgi:hypothetical protein